MMPQQRSRVVITIRVLDPYTFCDGLIGTYSGNTDNIAG